MKNICVLILLISSSFSALSDGICEFTKQEIQFFEFTERYPFDDKDFSSSNVAKAQKQLNAFYAGEEVKYFIPENTLNILKGGELMQKFLKAKGDFESYIPSDVNKSDRKKLQLEFEFLDARKKYCDFRRSHYAIDW